MDQYIHSALKNSLKIFLPTICTGEIGENFRMYSIHRLFSAVFHEDKPNCPGRIFSTSLKIQHDNIGSSIVYSFVTIIMALYSTHKSLGIS